MFFVENELSLLVDDAQIHLPGVKVDSAVMFVLLGIEFHLASSFWGSMIVCLTTILPSGRGGLL